MERAVLVYTTWPSIVEAEQAGHGLVLEAESVEPAYQAWLMKETESK